MTALVKKDTLSQHTKKRLDTLLVSDIHIGSSICRPFELINVLEKYSFKRLILLGDVFDDMNFYSLGDPGQLELIGVLIELSKRNDVEFVWVEGNHDYKKVIAIFSRIFGIQVVKEYTWTLHGKKYFAIHGDQFDEYQTRYKTFNKLAVFTYSLFQKMNTRFLRPSKLLRYVFSYSWKRSSEKVARGAVRYAVKKHSAHFVFCGHTHQIMDEEISGVGFHNTICFSDTPYGFITISQEAEILAHEHE